MILFSITAFFVFLFSMKKNYKAWKKWAVVFLIFGFLNTAQIYSEIKTNFSNTKVLLYFSSHDNNNENNEQVGKLTLIKNDIDCYIEANAYFLSSYGNSNCTYNFLNSTAYSQINTKNFSKFSKDFIDIFAMLAAIVFFGIGYLLLIAYGKNEKEKSGACCL